ncbi:MAG: hypothetical protein CUN55_16645 [Phototrophicales bacterium]|nr:MAG: hypothetical protein CUN55_16645 [Phototrophicales bacterium]RMG82999.1 MAG: hypothetical protein D6712_13755 [Chloroflexota bacterium]
MTKQQLPQEPKSLKKWQDLPRNQPSKAAMPPVAGGLKWAWGLSIVMIVLVLLVFLLQGRLIP